MNVMRVLLFVAAGVIVMGGINSSGTEKLSDIIPAYIGEKKANIKGVESIKQALDLVTTLNP